MKSSIFVLGFILLFFGINNSWAEVIHLKDGKKIKGKVVERGPTYTMIERNGEVKRYENNELERIDMIDDGFYENTTSIDVSQFNDITEKKVNLIIHLMQVDGTRTMLENDFQEIINNAPQENQEQLKDVFNIDDVFTVIIPIFDRYYTEDELIQMVQFFESKAGNKFINAKNEILKEIINASAQHFRKKMNL